MEFFWVYTHDSSSLPTLNTTSVLGTSHVCVLNANLSPKSTPRNGPSECLSPPWHLVYSIKNWIPDSMLPQDPPGSCLPILGGWRSVKPSPTPNPDSFSLYCSCGSWPRPSRWVHSPTSSCHSSLLQEASCSLFSMLCLAQPLGSFQGTRSCETHVSLLTEWFRILSSFPGPESPDGSVSSPSPPLFQPSLCSCCVRKPQPLLFSLLSKYFPIASVWPHFKTPLIGLRKPVIFPPHIHYTLAHCFYAPWFVFAILSFPKWEQNEKRAHPDVFS